MAVPERSFLVCANARSGSTLLCRALADTGVAGNAEEYFLTGPPEAFPPGWTFWEDGLFARGHDVADRAAYVELVHRLGSSANGVFAAKMMWNQVPWIVAAFAEMAQFAGRSRNEILRSVFPGLRIVHLTRRDRVRQAVSWVRAAQDGVWVVSEHEPAQPTGDPSYDERFIANLEQLIVDGEQGWRELAAELDVPIHEVVYEELVDSAAYESVVRGILEFLDVDTDVVIRPPRTHRQADHLNDEWVARYSTRPRAGVIVIRDGAMALLERHRAGQHYWVIPGGGVEPGESIEAAAVREAAEELGVAVEIDGLRAQLHGSYADGSPGHHWYFAATVDTDEIRVMGPELDNPPDAGTYEAVWVAVDELPSRDVRPAEVAELVHRYRDGEWPTDLVIDSARPF